ncbi:hypothetical protein [Streptomyces sp. YIM S03343]
MDLTTLAVLLITGIPVHFKARFGADPKGIHGTVVQLGAPGWPNLLVIRDADDNLREVDRRIVRLAR